MRCTRSGSASMEPIVIRGFRDAYGSWKIICIRRRMRRRASPYRPMISWSVELDAPVGRVDQPDHRPREGRLAAARLAHQAQRLAAAHVERHAVDGAHVADVALEDEPLRDREVDLQVANLERAAAPSAGCAAVARSRAPSPRRSCAGPGREAGRDQRLALGRVPARHLVPVRRRPAPARAAASSTRQRSWTLKQRGANGQPVISRDRSGGWPWIGTSSPRPRSSSRGIDCSRPTVYGCRGRPKSSAVVLRSMMWPAYITLMLRAHAGDDAQVVGDQDQGGVAPRPPRCASGPGSAPGS